MEMLYRAVQLSWESCWRILPLGMSLNLGGVSEKEASNEMGLAVAMSQEEAPDKADVVAKSTIRLPFIYYRLPNGKVAEVIEVIGGEHK